MTFEVVCDDREKKPWSFDAIPAAFPVSSARLETGDYTVSGFEDVFAVERKSIPDLIQSVTWGRDNFEAEIARAQDFAEWAIIIEGLPSDVNKYIEKARRRYGAKVHPNQVHGTVNSWNQHRGANFIYAGSREEAERLTYQKLREWQDRHAHVHL
jgi:DNA excision repair protein ERCC-4